MTFTPVKYDFLSGQVEERGAVCGISYEKAIAYATEAWGEEWAAAEHDGNRQIYCVDGVNA